MIAKPALASRSFMKQHEIFVVFDFDTAAFQAILR